MDGRLIGTRTEGPSSVNISFSRAVPMSLKTKVRELSNLRTDETQRKKGHATKLLRSVCSDADKNGVVLMLTADSDELAAWYAGFGFLRLQSQPILMARQPT